MNHQSTPATRLGLVLFPAFLLLAPVPGVPAVTDLANIPLTNATTAKILPNIMLDLDDSGSMAWDYMPDYVRLLSKDDSFTRMCRGVDSHNTLVVCEPGDPPYFANGFNTMHYNPEVRYRWPVGHDGAPKADLNGKTSYIGSWTAVASDGYGVQKVDKSSGEAPGPASCKSWASSGASCPVYDAGATVNMTAEYPERVWCASPGDLPSGPGCKSGIEGSSYLYPNATYKYLKVRYGAPYYHKVSVEWCKLANSSGTDENFGKAGQCQPRPDGTYKHVRYDNWTRVDITPGTVFPAKGADRTDCAGPACTYAEEMANFATWFAWYRTRTQMTKTAIGLAFHEVRGAPLTGTALLADPADADTLHARVGLTTINSYSSSKVKLNIAGFDTVQRSAFYAKLYGIVPSGGTPLRESLNAIGKMYQGASTVYADPVQYACQRNYTILASDGYWKNAGFSGLGDADGVAGASRPSYDALHATDTLADIAYHYYHTDLRPGSCTVCEDNVRRSGTDPAVDDIAAHQHMTTFTIGMGVDGALAYQDGYKTSTSGDYFDIKQGTKVWPVPTAGNPETVDDLWHAAVNGRGTYFSARNPSALETGLKKALSSIAGSIGSGAAAATSNLQPVSGDALIYVAGYRTELWDGEVNAHTVNLSDGSIVAKPVWQASARLNEKILSGASDTRTIYTANGTKRVLFTAGAGGLTADQLAYFDNTRLSQHAAWDSARRSAATPERMVNYLRGHSRFEDQAGNAAAERLYRDRDKILGDIVHAQPVYVKAPPFGFVDAGYDDFKKDKKDRMGIVYVAANDGMLHAFDAATGEERWAYIPPVVLPELWRLADANYSGSHRFFLDGTLTVTDANIGGAWRTVLIGALGRGGRGYYALDITDPLNPAPLWNFTADDDNNVGYTYGIPLVTKLRDTWVAVLTSGYNNVPEGGKYPAADGKGYVFVRDLATGAAVRTIVTPAGSIGSPSGLSRLNIKTVDTFSTDNKADIAYGGDLLGNMWRIDLEKGTASRLADFGPGKPVMTAPDIGEVEGHRVIYFGTGRYLGTSDLDDRSVQSIYGIKDDGTGTVTGTSGLVAQTISGEGATRSISSNAVDWSSKAGWYVDLPAGGERVTVDPQLFFGTLLVATTMPSATDCEPGGTGWLYQLDFMTGGSPSSTAVAATGTSSPIVGLTVSLVNGTPVATVVEGNGTVTAIRVQLRQGAGGGGKAAKRVLWRELYD